MFPLLGWAGLDEYVQMVSPSLHATVVAGQSSAADPASFSPGGHDPNRVEKLQVQGIEPSVSLRAGEHLEGFVTAVVFNNASDDWDWEMEEAFLKVVEIPGRLELRGGRYLNRVGYHNAIHQHSWTTVDAPLVNALFLGEDGLASEGGELTWLPCSGTSLSLSFGDRVSHEGEHGDHEEDHGHSEGESSYEAHAFESLQIEGDLVTLSARSLWRRDDFLSLSGTLAVTGGENSSGGDSATGLAGLELEWREHGREAGGRSVRWRNEVIMIDSERIHLEEAEHEGEGDDAHDEVDARGLGWTSLLSGDLEVPLSPFIRFDYVEAFDELELSSWERISVGGTWTLRNEPKLYCRIQANFDERGTENEESLWFQVGFSWGEGEVR